MTQDPPTLPTTPQSKEAVPALLPVGATSFLPGGWDGDEDLPDPSSLSHTLPAHLAVILRQPSPQGAQLLCSESSGCGCRENGWPLCLVGEHLGVELCGAGSPLILAPPQSHKEPGGQGGGRVHIFKLCVSLSLPGPRGGSSRPVYSGVGFLSVGVWDHHKGFLQEPQRVLQRVS